MSKSGLLDGIILGKEEEKFITTNDNKHVFLCGPTSSGKGSGFVIPNLLNWKHSTVIFDTTGKTFDATSGYRSKVLGNKIIKWNPAAKDGLSCTYNPFDWVSRDINEQVSDVMDICYKILPEEEFWQNEARNLLIGLLLYLLSNPDEIASMGRVVRVLKSDDVVYNLAIILDEYGSNIHPISYMNLASFLQKADKERSGVLSTLNSAVSAWADPILDELSETSDFNVKDIRKEKTSIYINTNPKDIKRLKPIIHILLQQIINSLCTDSQKNSEPVLLMIDDFSVFADTITFNEEYLSDKAGFDFVLSSLKNYNIVLCSVFQNYSQVELIFKNSNNLFANSAYRICYTTNDKKTADIFRNNAFIDDGDKVKMLDEHILPTLPDDKELLLTESQSAKIIDKISYYNDEFFRDKILEPINIEKKELIGPNYSNPMSEMINKVNEKSKSKDNNSLTFWQNLKSKIFSS